jgi:hypothetical protein
VRRESSTVVCLAGELPGPLLTELGRSANVSVIRPPDDAAGALDAAVRSLAEAARRMSPFVLVAADPLAGLAAAWQAMWDVAQGPDGAADFEQQAAEVLAAWQAGRFELPDYYLVITEGAGGEDPAGGAGFHLGPLRAARPRRVSAVVAAGGPEEAARVRQALRELPHGPWWPPLAEVIGTARGFYAGGLAEGAGSLAAP